MEYDESHSNISDSNFFSFGMFLIFAI